MKKYLLQLGLVSFTAGAQLLANPSGADVIYGDVTITDSPGIGLLTIESNSDRSIIDWDDFSIGVFETTDVILPDSTSALLNRVTSSNLSVLLGALTSNGNVYVINENGVLIGSNATIFTGGFLASALDTLDTQFLNGGNMDFYSSQSNYVINYGQIVASNGDVILIGVNVENSGTILANGHVVALGASHEVIVKPADSERITISVLGDSGSTGIGVNNSSTGYIQAMQAELKSDGNPYAFAVNHQGWINVTGVSTDQGRVFLHTESNSQTDGGIMNIDGLVTAVNSDATGGYVEITGNDITLNNNCFIDASGNAGGGTVLVGGSLLNMDPTIPTAYTTTVTSGTFIDVNANYFGTGGTCVIWADDTTTFYGSIQSTGGVFSGNGGIVEVCGVNSTDNEGNINVSANMGSDGLILTCP